MNRYRWTLRLYALAVIALLALLPAAALAATNDANTSPVPMQLLTISALVGLAMPGLIAAINRYHWSPQVKAACAFGSCVLAAILIAWWDATLDWVNIRVTILTVIGSALGFYHAWWRPSGLADSIEKKTG